MDAVCAPHAQLTFVGLGHGFQGAQKTVQVGQAGVGDGANDLPMLSIAGLGIAFRAKPIVKESARHAISTLGLDGILYLLGISDREAGAG